MRKLCLFLSLLLTALVASAQDIPVLFPFNRPNPNDNSINGYNYTLYGVEQHFATKAQMDAFFAAHDKMLQDGMTSYVRAEETVYRYKASTNTWLPVTFGNTYTASNGVTLSGLDMRADTAYLRTAMNSLTLAQLQTRFNQYVIANRNVGAGYGLSGGGNLSIDRLLAVDTTVIRTVANSPSRAELQTRLNGYVVTGRTVGTGTGLTGGGDLSANRTIAIDTSVIRTVANSPSKTELQTKLNGYHPLENQRLSTGDAPSFKNLSIAGAAGDGFVFLPNQSVIPGTPTNGVRIYATNSNLLSWKTPVGYSRSFYSPILTGDRIYTLSDKSYTLADDAEVVKVTGAQTVAGVKTLTDNPVVSTTEPTVTLSSTADGLSTTLKRSATTGLALTNVTTAAGGVGKAQVFNGTTQFARFNQSFASNIPAVTVSLWMKSTTTVDGRILLKLGNGGNSSLTVTLRSSGTMNATYNGGSIGAGPLSGSLVDGNWHQIVVTADNSVPLMRVYIDNQLRSSAAGSIFIDNSSSDGIIGAQTVANTNNVSGGFVNATIDQVLVYNRALTIDEVATNWNNGVGVGNPVSNGLQRYWAFDTGSTSTDPDLVTGVAANAVTFTNNPAVDANGKVPVSGNGASAQKTVLRSYNGRTSGDEGITELGSQFGQFLASGNFINTSVNGSNPFSIGKDGRVRIDPNYKENRDANGSVSPYANLYVGAGTSTVGQVQLASSPTPTASASNAGSLQNVGGNLVWVTPTAVKQLNDQSTGGAAAPDTTVYRTVANSTSKADLQTKLNGYVSQSGSYANPSFVNSLAYSKITGAPTKFSQFINDQYYLKNGDFAYLDGVGATNSITSSSGLGRFGGAWNPSTSFTGPAAEVSYENGEGVYSAYDHAGSTPYLPVRLQGSAVTLSVNNNGSVVDVIKATTAGKVGIGTITPTEKLEVTGNIKASAFKVTGGTATQLQAGDGSLVNQDTFIPNLGYTWITGKKEFYETTSFYSGTNFSPFGGAPNSNAYGYFGLWSDGKSWAFRPSNLSFFGGNIRFNNTVDNMVYTMPVDKGGELALKSDIVSGSYSGNGGSTVVTINHGLNNVGETSTIVGIVPQNDAAAGWTKAIIDASTVKIYYNTATPASNCVYYLTIRP